VVFSFLPVIKLAGPRARRATAFETPGNRQGSPRHSLELSTKWDPLVYVAMDSKESPA